MKHKHTDTVGPAGGRRAEAGLKPPSAQILPYSLIVHFTLGSICKRWQLIEVTAKAGTASVRYSICDCLSCFWLLPTADSTNAHTKIAEF